MHEPGEGEIRDSGSGWEKGDFALKNADEAKVKKSQHASEILSSLYRRP